MPKEHKVNPGKTGMAQQTWEVLPIDKSHYRAKLLTSSFEGHFCAIGLDDDIPSVILHEFSDTDTDSITEAKFKLSGHSKPLTCLNSSRSYVVSGSKDKTAILWNVSDGQIVQQFVSHSKPLTHVAVAEESVGIDEILVATVTSSNVITIYHLDGTVKFSFKEPKHFNIRGICLLNYNYNESQSKNPLLVLFGDNGMLKFITRSGETRSVPIGTHSNICCAAVSPDASLLAIGTQSGVTILFDLLNMEEIFVLESPDDKSCGAVVSLGYNHNKYNMSVVYEKRVVVIELQHKHILAQWDLEGGEGVYLRGQYSHDRFVMLSSQSKLSIRTLKPEV